MTPPAFGSQTAASLVRPATCCGVCGFRPTIGGYDLDGGMGLSPSLDTPGVLARDPSDLVLADAVLRGTNLLPAPDLEDQLPRIALMRGPHWLGGSVEMRDARLRAPATIAAAGAETGEMAHPAIFAELAGAHGTVMSYGSVRLRGAEFAAGVPAISKRFHALIVGGRRVTDAEYRSATETRDCAGVLRDRLFEDIDALLAPSAPGTAPEGLGATGDPLFSRIWNLLQTPALAVPFGTAHEDLPIGFQLIGRRGSDSRLLEIGQWLHDVLKPDRRS